MLVYGAGRRGSIDVPASPLPESTLDLEEAIPFAPVPGTHPAFLDQFEIRVADAEGGVLPFTGSSSTSLTWWIRHRDSTSWGTCAGLITLADVTPPAMAPMLPKPSPVSSVNWQLDLFNHDLASHDGWYVLTSQAQQARDGWSAQEMMLWNSDGILVAAGRQSVVYFE